MKILILTQYFYPESFIINDLVKCLILDSHSVEVLTGKPNYPDGKIFAGYRAFGKTIEYFHQGVCVNRVPIVPRGNGGALRLLINYLSFVVSSLFYIRGIAKNKQFDAIVVFAPSPVTSAISGIYLKKYLECHLALWVQDLWPESLSATGFIKNRFLLRAVGELVRWIYKQSDTLLVQSRAFASAVERYAPISKVVYYPNSYLRTEEKTPLISDIPVGLLNELKENFCVVFAGNLGTAQALGTVLDAASYLSHLKKFKIVIVGDGSMATWLHGEIAHRNLTNFCTTGRISYQEMPTIFKYSQALLVTLTSKEIFSYTIPSKVQAYMAAGKPIIASINGECARIINEAGAGLTSPAEDAKALADNIKKLFQMSKSERNKLGEAGRTYFLKHFEMDSQSKRLIEILQNRIAKAGEVL